MFRCMRSNLGVRDHFSTATIRTYAGEEPHPIMDFRGGGFCQNGHYSQIRGIQDRDFPT